MTQVVIPAVQDGAGGHLPASVSVRLVGADDLGRIAFLATDLATEYQDLALPATGLTLDLAAQSDLALPNAAETWYRIEIRTPHRGESFFIQVPDSIIPLNLRDLVGASAILPGDLPADIIATVLSAAAAAQASAESAAASALSAAESAALAGGN